MNFLELEPLALGDNTEVKVPVRSTMNTMPSTDSELLAIHVNRDASPNIASQEDSILTNNKSIDFENDDCVEIESQDELVNLLPADEPYCLPYYNTLLQLCRDLPRDMFVDRILLDYEQSESKFEEIRSELFGFLKCSVNFQFGPEYDLKRRLNIRKSDPACVKLAYDIHSIMLVFDGADQSILKDILSVTKKSSRTSSVTNSVSRSTVRPQGHQDKCMCSTELASLKDALSTIQADVLLMKQRQAAAENLRVSDLQEINKSVKEIQSENGDVRKQLHDNVNNINTCISNIEKSLTQKTQQINQRIDSYQNFQEVPCIQDTVTPDTKRVCTLVDAATQYDVNDAYQSNKILPASVPNTIITIGANQSTDLIELDSNVAYQPLLPTVPIPTPSVECESKEEDSCFGNTKIPTIITGQRKRKPRTNHRKNKGNINFAVIRKKVAEASQDRNIEESQCDDDDFIRYVRKPPKRYFVSGFIPSITEAKIAQYVTERYLNVTKVEIFRKIRNNKTFVIVQVNVEDDGNADNMINDPYFWPRGVTCRPWLSRGALRRRTANRYRNHHGNNEDQYHYDYDTYTGDYDTNNGDYDYNYPNDVGFQNRFSPLDGSCDID